MIKSKKITLLASAVVGSLFLLASVDAMAAGNCTNGRNKADQPQGCSFYTDKGSCENRYWKKDKSEGKYCKWTNSNSCVNGDQCIRP